MSTIAPATRRAAVVPLVLCLLWAMLPRPAPAGAPPYRAALPFVAAPPGVIRAGSEAELRQAIAAANAAGQMPTIELTADVTLQAALPPLDNPGAGVATLDGQGHTIDGGGHGPILTVALTTTVVIDDLTLIHGQADDCGGAILVYGDLTLRHSALQDSQANHGGGLCLLSEGGQATARLEASRVTGNTAGDGGGIYVKAKGGVASLQVVDSTVSGNRATGHYGGGILAYASTGAAGVTILRSTVSLNAAPIGAGLFNLGVPDAPPVRRPTAFAVAVIDTSTFSGNVARDDGGAIANYSTIWPYPDGERPGSGAGAAGPARPLAPGLGFGAVYVYNSTISGNRAVRGSGIYDGDWQVYLSGTIVAGNGPGGDCAGYIVSQGYNLDGDDTCGLHTATDRPAAEADLQPLALYPPGQTATHALGPASAARDRIPLGEAGCASATTDQRGVARPQPAAGRCDIGAYEEVDEG